MYLGGGLSADHDVPVVQLDVGVGVLVEEGVGAAGRGAAHELPIVCLQLVTSGCSFALGDGGQGALDHYLWREFYLI